MPTIEFFITTLIVVVVPGTGVIYTVSTALLRGWRASIMAAIGCTLGIIPHLLATILGLSFLLHQSALLFQGLKWFGVAYLLYLAWHIWRQSGALELTTSKIENRPFSIISRAMLINLLNPKLTIFFFAFLPQFIEPTSVRATAELLTLSIIFMLVTLFIFLLYALLASRFRNLVEQSDTAVLWLQRTFAAAFALLGLRLALSD